MLGLSLNIIGVTNTIHFDMLKEYTDSTRGALDFKVLTKGVTQEVWRVVGGVKYSAYITYNKVTGGINVKCTSEVYYGE